MVLDVIATENIPIRLHNADTDRIYLADTTGLIQCLHEVEQSEPFIHDKERKEAAETRNSRAEPKKEITGRETGQEGEAGQEGAYGAQRAACPQGTTAPKERPAPRSGPPSRERVKKATPKNRPAPQQTRIPSTSRPAMRGNDNKAKGAATRSESGGLDPERRNP